MAYSVYSWQIHSSSSENNFPSQMGGTIENFPVNGKFLPKQGWNYQIETTAQHPIDLFPVRRVYYNIPIEKLPPRCILTISNGGQWDCETNTVPRSFKFYQQVSKRFFLRVSQNCEQNSNHHQTQSPKVGTSYHPQIQRNYGVWLELLKPIWLNHKQFFSAHIYHICVVTIL